MFRARANPRAQRSLRFADRRNVPRIAESARPEKPSIRRSAECSAHRGIRPPREALDSPIRGMFRASANPPAPRSPRFTDPRNVPRIGESARPEKPSIRRSAECSAHRRIRAPREALDSPSSGMFRASRNPRAQRSPRFAEPRNVPRIAESACREALDSPIRGMFRASRNPRAPRSPRFADPRNVPRIAESRASSRRRAKGSWRVGRRAVRGPVRRSLRWARRPALLPASPGTA